MSRDLSGPIRGQYLCHIIFLDQSEASIEVTLSVLKNQRPVFRSCAMSGPIRGQYYLTRVLAGVPGADHVGRDVRGGVGGVRCRALGVGHRVHINLQSDLGRYIKTRTFVIGTYISH